LKITAIYNIKGGVGKTTTAVNLACLLAKMNLSILIWDLDPQGGTSYFFNKAGKNDNNFLKLFSDYISVYDVIEPTDTHHIDIICNDSKFSEQFINSASHLTRVHFFNNEAFGYMLNKVRDDYDICIIDCPPGRFAIHDNVFKCASAVLVPNIPAPLSVYCSDLLNNTFQKFTTTKVLNFFNMVQVRKNLHKTYMSTAFNAQQLTTYIPFYTEIETITHNKESIFHKLKNAKSITFYEDLWEEVCDKMNWAEFKQQKGKVLELKPYMQVAMKPALIEKTL
jgi:chromosome partitioning protein